MPLPNLFQSRRISPVRSQSRLQEFRDGLAEQGTAGGQEHQVKIDQLQASISGLSMAEIFRILGLPKVNAVRPPAKIPTIRSTVELSQGNPGLGFSFRWGRKLFQSCIAQIFEFGSCGTPCPYCDGSGGTNCVGNIET